MSIVAINTVTRFGKQGTIQVNRMDELSGDGETAYAHSMDEAVAWVKSQTAFADVEPYSLGDGRLVFESAWAEKGGLYHLFDDYNEVTHTRLDITIYPVNTIFVAAGYR